MELKVSAEKPGFSSSDCASDPEDKEISEDEDDDRNHKHRRREEARSQSMEGDSLDQGLNRPYRKRNRPFENGYSYREGDSQSGDTWKNYNYASDRDFPSRFEKRRPNQASFSRAPLELNQRMRGNQMMPVEVGPVRGRGRESISWGIRDSRLGLVDVASQMVQPGPVPPRLFGGRGLPNVPNNAQNTSWNAFGLVPNGGLDSLHPLGLQGAMRPAINPPMNMGIPRQRCRDFEERGFCLRGDMCPMEHGVNRIVIEDVQSLSQFNLPVSLPGSQLLGISSGSLPVTSTASGSLVNSKSFHTKSNKPGVAEDGFDLNGASDVYDPDQPLWTNNDPETSSALLALNQSNAGELVSLPEMESYEGFNDERQLRNPQNSSVWGRINSSKRSGLGVKEKTDSVGTSSNYLGRDMKTEEAINKGPPNVSHQGKWTNADGNGQLVKESSVKLLHSDSARNNRKPAQKALRTLFVNGIPLKDNKREGLLSHFQKFGEVIDIHIPMHTERAFVQFSKREEAEAALKAPDAVMANRFIKLWWANRDNIPDDGISGPSSVPFTPRPFILDKGKENPQPAGGKDGNSNASAAQLPFHDHPKAVVGNGPKAPPQQQKKLENLELLKEELRKKQEMLDHKRNEFKRQLDKLQKHAVGTKDVAVTVTDSTSKQLKGETPSDQTAKSSPRDNKTTEKPTPAEPHISTIHPAVPVQEPLKPSFRPATPFVVNRFKLDNRPTAFRIASPLPAGLANVDALKEHFSTFGEVSSVELEESESQETNEASVQSNVSAHVSFTTRRFAEKGFLHGKIWRGQNLQFTWLTPTNSGKESGGPGNVSASTVTSSDAKVQPNSSSGKDSGGPGNISAVTIMPSDANIQPSGENASSPSQEAAVLGNGEADVDSVEEEKDSFNVILK